MARGRMLNKSISYDRCVAELDNRVAYGAHVFTWLIAHADVDGRMHGEPCVIKGSIFPRLNRVTVEIIEETLAVASELGLLVWYEHGGDRYLALPGFDKNQEGLRKNREARSIIPAPEDSTPAVLRSYSGVTPQVGGNAPAQFGLREVNLKEVNTSEAEAPAVESQTDSTPLVSERNNPNPPDPETEHHRPAPRRKGREVTPDMQAVMAYFRKVHPEYTCSFPKSTVDLIRQRLREFSVEALQKAIDAHAVDEKYLKFEAMEPKSVFVTEERVQKFLKAFKPKQPAYVAYDRAGEFVL